MIELALPSISSADEHCPPEMSCHSNLSVIFGSFMVMDVLWLRAKQFSVVFAECRNVSTAVMTSEKYSCGCDTAVKSKVTKTNCSLDLWPLIFFWKDGGSSCSLSVPSFKFSGLLSCLSVFPFFSFSAVHSCAISNGGCEHYCVQQSAAHFRCRCKPNYVLAEDGKHCKREYPNSGVRQH